MIDKYCSGIYCYYKSIFKVIAIFRLQFLQSKKEK